MEETEPAYAPIHLSPLARARAILGGSAGNLIEWYDWFAYASFSLYFAKAFFPSGDQTAQLLQTASVFAIGFFMRPIGAWITGVFADRAGRKNALTLSVAFMCLGSLILAVAPSYAQVGPAAPAILVLARVIQGLSLGGEYGASATYLAEMAGQRRRGLWSSFHFVTLIGGQLAALAVLIVLQNTLSERDLEEWGWRIAFAIGALLAVAVYWIQRHLQETASFHAVQAAGVERSVTATLVRGHWRASAIVFALTAGGSLGFYCFTTYMQKFLTNTAHFSKAVASDISAASLVVYLLAQPIGGALGDRLGRRALLTGAFVLGAAATWPVMTSIAGATSPWTALILVCVALIILTGYSSVSAVVKSELFPAHVRGLGVALPYALGNAIFGGTAEYVALWFKQAGHESGFYLYVSLVLAAGGVAAVIMRETRGAIAED